VEYIEKTEKHNDDVSAIIRGWGSDIIITRGKPHKAEDLDGILACEDRKIIGLGLYYIKGNNCELVLLETFLKNKGIGTIIIEKIKKIAKLNNCNRLWLVTSNDNIDSIKFYQRKGFNIANIYINVMDEYRKIKPEIPFIGNYEIPIRDEIVLEISV